MILTRFDWLPPLRPFSNVCRSGDNASICIHSLPWWTLCIPHTFHCVSKKKKKKIVDTFGCLFVRFYIVYNALLWTAVVLLSECLGWRFCIDSGRFHGRTDERLPKNLVSSFPFPFGLCVVWPRPSVVRLDGSVVSFAFTDFRFFCRTVKVLNDGGDKQRW